MRHIFTTILILLFCGIAKSQSSAQLTITPANPGPSDTIYVVSTLTYSGACSYGLVYTYTAVTADTLKIFPTYCGHGSSTPCMSTDTFKINPQLNGNYVILIEYHQGSICPISNFDEKIGQVDTTITVTNNVTGLRNKHDNLDIKLYPNPVTDKLFITLPSGITNPTKIEIRDLTGRLLISQLTQKQETQLTLRELPAGMYLVTLESDNKKVSKRMVVNR